MAFDPLSAALEIGGKVIDRLWPDPAQAQAAKVRLFEMQRTGELAQLTADTQMTTAQAAINAAEATNTNAFVAGWRPFIGWTCGSAFAYKFVVMPLMVFALAAIGRKIELPPLDISDLTPVLIGMLGLGAMRSYEKVKRVA